MNDENNTFGEQGQPPMGGAQPQPPDPAVWQDQNPVRLDKGPGSEETGSGPVRLGKEGQPAGNGGPADYGRQPYGDQPGNSQQNYSSQPGGGQDFYGGQPGGSQQYYGSQPEGGQNQSTPLSGYAEPVYQQESQSTVSAESGGFGIASMVCGILSIISCCVWCVSLPLAVVSIILGILQISKGTAKGMAIAGIICSAVGILMMLCFLVWFVVFQASDSYYDLMREMQYMNYRHHR